MTHRTKQLLKQKKSKIENGKQETVGKQIISKSL